MNTVEFSLREFNTGGFPKGLSLMLAVMPNWLYERGAPTDALRFEEPLAALKKRIAAGDDVFEVRARVRVSVRVRVRVSVRARGKAPTPTPTPSLTPTPTLTRTSCAGASCRTATWRRSR